MILLTNLQQIFKIRVFFTNFISEMKLVTSIVLYF